METPEHPRIIVSYTMVKLTAAAWALSPAERADLIARYTASARGCGERVYFYQIFPARADYDFLIWSASTCQELTSPDRFFANGAAHLNAFRQHLDVPLIFCGITKPSIYIRQRANPQEIDPFSDERKPYFVIYPFSKTPDWYMKSREERQMMMSAHIKLGMSYPQIKQLLLYSFGIQDQEFIVAYEMDDLPMFSDLVQDLRSTEARPYTLLDTPIITGVQRQPDELAALFGVQSD
ncbi:MAG: chlorite dismutase family protein [Verrucomicrobia bacterium]|nr:chlorite dismutase family protein [Verrucomicrobiota bacterium]